MIVFTHDLSIFLNFFASVVNILDISPSLNTLSKLVHNIYTFTHNSKVP